MERKAKSSIAVNNVEAIIGLDFVKAHNGVIDCGFTFLSRNLSIPLQSTHSCPLQNSFQQRARQNS